jgi:hypothetical protein
MDRPMGWRRWFKTGSRPGWLWLVAPVTVAYLLLEFSFSARLLDVIGGMPTDEQVKAIEHWGRLLSGFALALVLWPSLLSIAARHGWSARVKAVSLAVVTAVTMVAVFQAEGWLDRYLVDRSSAEQRQVAMNVGLLQRGLAERMVVLHQFDVNPAIFEAPEGKAFLGLFPLLAFSQDDINQRLLPQRPAIVRAVIEHRGGYAADYYNRFQTSLHALQNDYNAHYVPGYNRYVDAINGIAERQDKAWADYVGRLRQHRWVGQRIAVPRAYWSRVRSDVRRSSVPVPSDWAPDDRTGFYRAVDEQVRRQADSQFRHGVKAAFPTAGDIAPGTRFEAIASRDSVQKSWAKKLGYPASTVGHPYQLPISLPTDAKAALAQYREQVYEPVIALLVERTLEPYNVQLAELADGQPQAELGRSAYRRMIVPPLALGFSMLGALVHVFKSLFYLVQLASGVAFRRSSVKFACVVVLSLLLFALAPYVVSSEVAAQPLYQTLLNKVRQLGGHGDPTLGGRLLAFGMDGAVHVEKIGYGLFEVVRVDLLGGVEFNHDPLPRAD